ncbi:hypothetical protein [Pseudovibrio sp. SPO723]|uniref:hypothetical protein n=1 Tax=Nesiotobacter zosterae TaxID=392721 RepID=UPI0029C3F69C|nr:hypothetical protein [Pseudovibrio sp. SPO723]MDX5592274.1 hypothetical protein [Pseudovibrio sp. SPO723]
MQSDHQNESEVGMSFYMLVFALVFLCMSLATLVPSSASRVAILSAPWSTAAIDSAVAAEGALLGTIGNGRYLVVAASDKPDFIEQLYNHGALLVLSPLIFDACRSGLNAFGE